MTRFAFPRWCLVVALLVGAVLAGIAAALVVGALLLMVGLRVPGLDLLAESAVVLVGVPAVAYVVVTVLFARRGRVPPMAALLVGVAGLAVLHALGGQVLMLAACGIAPSGGC